MRPSLASLGFAPGFEAGPITTVEIAGRSLRALRYRTGASMARATHLTALWPESYETGAAERFGDEGLAIELTLGGELEAEALLERPELALVVASLH